MSSVAIIVPVLRRPRNALPFMQSLSLTTDDVAVYAVADADDIATREAWIEVGATIVDSTGISFPCKVNDGYRATTEPWLFIVGDDVRFHMGWKQIALQRAEETGCQVIGTNDLTNPRVTAGQHATHFFIYRNYIDTFGASLDGPGIVCHEGYRHWYVDDEIVGLAQQRRTFFSALDSIVEHIHPAVGKAERDDVYHLGESKAVEDGALFNERRRIYGLVG